MSRVLSRMRAFCALLLLTHTPLFPSLHKPLCSCFIPSFFSLAYSAQVHTSELVVFELFFFFLVLSFLFRPFFFFLLTHSADSCTPCYNSFFFFFVQRVSVCRSLLAFYCQTIHTNGAFLFPSPFPLFFYIDVVFIYISDSPFPFSTLLRLLFVFYNLLVTFAFFFLSLSLIATKLVTLI